MATTAPITNNACGQKLNIYMVTNGSITDDVRNKYFPPLSLIFVPSSYSDEVKYKMYISDENGKIHDIISN